MPPCVFAKTATSSSSAWNVAMVAAMNQAPPKVPVRAGLFTFVTVILHVTHFAACNYGTIFELAHANKDPAVWAFGSRVAFQAHKLSVKLLEVAVEVTRRAGSVGKVACLAARIALFMKPIRRLCHRAQDARFVGPQ